MLIYLTIVSAACILMAITLLARRIHYLLSGTRTNGEFVGWHTRGLGRPYYHATIRFTDRKGDVHEFVSNIGSSKKREPAATYPVVYTSNAPEKAMHFSLLAYWSPVLAFLAIGAGAAIPVLREYNLIA
ncbi:DUF3592 domain-containing protein [Pelagicoccus mobilis]|uniref:DUF3592 domain-containing protein n=1 Tax=Pelagicoccus mobilis TaxID=415221 RepID=A0A934RUA0_9BACT|nr:DUF3592 domain-containing protein [Pelagicoccus mobilis]MBK1875535.1 hypothetical protein [Pelagicoccus mobilis]